MTSAPGSWDADRSHYSYARYADPVLAERFDAMRFGGPIGQLLLETQQAILFDALAPVAGRQVVDVGTGTGRAAIALAKAGARVTALDASPQMLDVARQRASEAGAAVQFDVADAHALPLADRSVDAAVCLRVLMHVPDWRRCVAELCRVARWRVLVDFPALLSFASLEAGARRLGAVAGIRTEPYRLLVERAVAQEFAARGFRVVSIHRQFVLPIALHKALGSRTLTTSVERVLAGVGALRLLGSPVTMVVER